MSKSGRTIKKRLKIESSDEEVHESINFRDQENDKNDLHKRIKIESSSEEEYESADFKTQRNDNNDFIHQSKTDDFDFDREHFKIEPSNGNVINGILGKKKAKDRKRKRVRFKANYEKDCERVEPNNDDIIDEILEKKRAEEELPPVTIENLRNLTIKLRHDVPPQHQVERSAGSHVPSAAEKAAFRRLAPKNQIKNGVFTPKEDQLIVDNWKAFCEDHYWDESNAKPFLYMRHNGRFYLKQESERRKFVQFLANGLPRRTLYSVYHRFRILYDIPKLRTKYAPHEDEYIIKYIEHNENVDKTCMFADLAKALNRSRASVWRRYRLLKQKREYGELINMLTD